MGRVSKMIPFHEALGGVNAALSSSSGAISCALFNRHGLRRYLLLDHFHPRPELATGAAQEAPLIESPCPGSFELAEQPE
jgi:hypothetical protein